MGATSAFTGAVVALEAFQSVASEGGWSIERIDSRAVRRADSGASAEAAARFVPHVKVELEVTASAEGGAKAEEAFLRWESRLERQLETLTLEDWNYKRCEGPLMDVGLVQPSKQQNTATEPAGPTIFRGTHRALLEVRIPASLVGGLVRPAVLDGGRRAGALAGDQVPMYLRRTAQDRNVRLGNLTVSHRAPSDQDAEAWSLKVGWRDGKHVDMARVLNFLYLTATGTRSLGIDSLEIVRVPGGAGLKLSASYALAE